MSDDQGLGLQCGRWRRKHTHIHRQESHKCLLLSFGCKVADTDSQYLVEINTNKMLVFDVKAAVLAS